MTKMEDEEMSGGESQADVPASNQNRTPSSDSGEGGARYCEQCPSETKIDDSEPSIICSGCNQQILDKYYMKVDGRSWHEKCVSCGNCGKPLSDSCFSKNFKLFCKDCYKQLQYCHRCSGSISGDELVMRVGDDSYHVTCFLCDYCRRQLKVGDKFLSLHETTSRKICCKTCYDMDDVSNLRVTETDSEDSTSEHDVFSPGIFPHPPDAQFMKSSHPPYGRQLSDFSPGPPPPHLQGLSGTPNQSMMVSSDPKRAKRPRTILTTAQRKKFKASFEISQKPCRKVRETLASETGLTPRVVQVWFQNQRAKVKKMARRQSQGDTSTRRGRRRRDVDSDSENDEPCSPGSYTSTSTPHQTPSYPDYQSPSSVQSSTAQDDNARMFSPSFHPYDQRMDGRGPSEGPFYPPAALPHSPTHLEMHQMLHERIGVQHDMTQPGGEPAFHGRENLDTYAISRQADIADISHQRPLGGDTCGGSTNPIDSLMYMQSSFFSTS